MKNYLFVCGKGVSRSPAAASAAQEIANERRKKILTECVGIYSGAKISADKISTFDKIFVMEEEMIKTLRQEYNCKKPIINLDVKDIYYQYDDYSELIEVMKSKLRKHI